MPYIPQEHRDVLDKHIDKLVKQTQLDKIPEEKLGGVLNYIICRLAVNIMGPKGYVETSNMLGHVRSAETEMRRRLLDRYEDECIYNNGDLEEFREYNYTIRDLYNRIQELEYFQEKVEESNRNEY